MVFLPHLCGYQMPKYIHQLEKWPDFNWNNEVIVPILSNLRHKQGRMKDYNHLLINK